jgi:hypothetical protein
MVIDLAACQVHGTDKAGPTVKGSARFDAYMIQADGTIAYAMTHFTVRPDKTPVNEFLSYRVRTNGKVGNAQHRFKPRDIRGDSRDCIRLRHREGRDIPLVRGPQLAPQHEAPADKAVGRAASRWSSCPVAFHRALGILRDPRK